MGWVILLSRENSDFGVSFICSDYTGVVVGFCAGNGVLIMEDMVVVHFFVNSETSFSMEVFKLLTFSFHEMKNQGAQTEKETDLVFNGARELRLWSPVV